MHSLPNHKFRDYTFSTIRTRFPVTVQLQTVHPLFGVSKTSFLYVEVGHSSEIQAYKGVYVSETTADVLNRALTRDEWREN